MPKGPKGEKRPADVIGAAVMVARIATGEIEDTKGKSPNRSKGGKRLQWPQGCRIGFGIWPISYGSLMNTKRPENETQRERLGEQDGWSELEARR
jgi:hypothetical protein